MKETSLNDWFTAIIENGEVSYYGEKPIDLRSLTQLGKRAKSEAEHNPSDVTLGGP